MLLPRRLLTLAVASLMLPGAARPRTILAATPISRMDLPWWRARHEAKLRELAARRPNLIFLGDSITQDWELSGPPAWRDFLPVWQHFYGNRNAVNLGFKGDTTASLLWRIRHGEVANIAPRAAVVLIGANNMGRPHWSAEDTVRGIDTILADLRQRLPSTSVLLMSVLPSERSSWVTETTNAINKALSEKYPAPPYRDGQPVTFVDVTDVFMHNGRLDRDAFLDGRLVPPEPLLHPTAEAQGRMAAAIEPTLAAMLHDKPREGV
jgi:lysophospholipase L1-like esterase